MACLRTLTTLSSLGLLLACASPPADPPPTREKAVQAGPGVTSRTAVGRAAAAPTSRLANYDARSAEAARGSVALRASAFQWAQPGGSRTAAASAVAAPRSAVEAARSFLGLAASGGRASARAAGSGGALDETILTGLHDVGRGPVILQFQRRVAGLDVFGQSTAVALTRDLRPVARSGVSVAPDRAAPGTRAFALAPTTAMAAALSDVTGDAYGAGDLVTAEAKNGYDRADLSAAVAGARAVRLVAPARARKVLFPLAGELVPAYQVEVALQRTRGPLQGFAYVISAADGSVLVRRNQVQNDFTYRVWADPSSRIPYEGPQGLAGTPHPTGLPDGYQPDAVAQSAVTLDAFPFTQNDPWLDDTATVTWGNNALAYADIVPLDGPDDGDVIATATGPNTFDTSYDLGAAPDTAANQQAAIVQLFYDVNFFHDWYYDSGFDEAAGNAQDSNYGRGGVEGDFLVAEAQDWEGFDNANMYTPADGFNPVMQMFLFFGNGERDVEVLTPPAIAGKYEGQSGSFGPSEFDQSGTVVAAVPADACSPITNGADLDGKIALVDRGGGTDLDPCYFTDKIKRAQDVGAVGVIVRNVNSSQAFGGMGAPDTYDGSVTIPSLLVPLDTGTALAAHLGALSVRLYRHEPMRDGTVDNLIVAHEWGHYISNRLVGNGGGLQNVQAGGLGEGWGDTHAMLLAVREEDALVGVNAGFGGTYGLAGWTSGGTNWDGTGNQGYYFGIRRVPYSTDMTKDPLTFRHIADGQRLVPVGSLIPVAFGADGAGNSEVHNAGEVWATMLWECYAALLRDTLEGSARPLTFQEAQLRWKDYLVAAYKLTPTNPTLLEARDALLAVALAQDQRDYQLFWQAFAKRGAGVTAIGPDKWTSFDNNPVVESYAADPHFSVVSVAFQSEVGSCTDGDAYLDAGESGSFTVRLENDGVSAVPAIQAAPSGSGFSFPASVVDVPASAAGEVVEVTVPVAMKKRPSSSQRSFVLAFPATADTVAFSVEVPATVSRDVVPASSATDSFQEPDLVWTVDGTWDGQPGWKPTPDGAWAEGTNGTSDLRLVSPDLVVGSGALTITITHRHLFEIDGAPTYYDGGVVELSEEGGDWVDIGGGAGVYDGTLFDGGLDDPNPLGGRDAFTYASLSYPDFDTVGINLGTAYSGKTVKVRFRMGSDMAVGWGGWTIQSVQFAGLTNTPFPAVRKDAGKCFKGGGGGGCGTGGGATGLAALLAVAALALRQRRRRAG